DVVAVEKCAGRDRHAASGEPNERIDVVVGQVSPDVVWKSRERHEVAPRAPYPIEPGERSGNVGDDERIRRKTASDREQRRRDVRVEARMSGTAKRVGVDGKVRGGGAHGKSRRGCGLERVARAGAVAGRDGRREEG